MIAEKKTNSLYLITGLFILINCICIAFDFLWFPLVPALLLIILAAFFALDKLFFLVVLLTPLAINIEDPEVRLGLSLPTEPIMFGIMLIYLLKQLYENRFDKKISTHPVTIAIVCNLIWIFITCITSEMPFVSFKFFLARLWFVVCFYFLAIQVFKKYKNINHFNWLYIIPLIIVIFYTVISHAQYRFEEKPANWVMKPFYNDHTAYGAILAMFFPLIIYYTFGKNYKFSIRMISFFTLLIFIVAIIFSYTRATWLSLVAAAGIYLLFLLKIKARTIILTALFSIGIFFAFKTEIIMSLEKNRQDSSDDFAEHLQSISNISSDASNLERLNRWSAAFRMFSERPFFGWGPGTYSFQYAPFQHSSDRTTITTNAGNRGNAHSEYIGPLVDSGVLGTVSFLAIVISVIYTASSLYKRIKTKKMKGLMLAIFLGLATYFIHGVLNNFLDTDKASVPFWGFIAALVAMDVYHKEELEVGSLKTEDRSRETEV